jgi:hypothetical protein
MAISTGMALMAGASVLGGVMGADAAEDAANSQANSAANATAEQRRQFDLAREDLAPYRETGGLALNRLAQLTGLKPGETPAQYQAQDPGYQFRLDEGNKAIQNSALARGGAFSGRAAKDLMRFNQGQASQEYGQSYNRLASLAGVGQTATNSGNELGANYANNAASNMIGAGNARASGYIGQANAISGGIGNAINGYQNTQMMNRLWGSAPTVQLPKEW